MNIIENKTFFESYEQVTRALILACEFGLGYCKDII